ncbi:MAG: protein kinase [Sandaracinaceae bacterium]|nr:protein kinase [Sandaracinaceae bacterium]
MTRRAPPPHAHDAPSTSTATGARELATNPSRGAAEDDPRAWLPARFRVASQLGRGAFGTVLAADDLERDERVALKVLRRRDGASVARFKREFRDLAQLAHPCLPALYELHAVDDRLFFTMELVDGVSLDAWVGAAEPRGAEASTQWSSVAGEPASASAPRVPAAHAVDLARLEACVDALADVLGYLHAQGYVHGDVKPSNILVRPDGQLVLLDFGMALEREEIRDGFAGTRRYAAPEVGPGHPTPAEDVYAVGAVVFELVAGRAPFHGEGLQLTLEKRRRRAASLSEVAPWAPPSLCERVDRWLDPDPHARGAFARAARDGAAPFVGREAELALVDRVYDEVARGRGRAILVRAEAGYGKTAFLRAVLARWSRRAPPPRVVRSQASARDRLPYAAIEGLLAMCEPEALGAEPSRQALARALAESLRRRAQDGPICVVVDDVHFAAADSVAVLERLLRPPLPPGVLFLLASRPDAAGYARLSLPAPVTTIELGALADDEAHALLRACGTPADAAPALVRCARGQPLFLRELGADDVTATTYPDLVARRLATLSSVERRALALVCLGARALPAARLQRLVPEAGGRIGVVLASLEKARLVRPSGDGVVPLHDLVRERVLSELDARDRRALHERVLATLTGARAPDASALVEHLLGAGRRAEAAARAEEAARDAAAQRAYGRAAELYALARAAAERDEERARLLADELDVLERAQLSRRAGEVAEALLALVREPAERARLAIRAAYHHVCAGELGRGYALLDRAFGAVGRRWPRTELEAFARIAAAELGAASSVDEVDPVGRRVALELLTSASNALGMIDNVRGRLFKLEALHIARRCGTRAELAELLLRDAVYLAAAGESGRRRVDARVREARALFPEGLPPAVAAIELCVHAIFAFQAGVGLPACDLLSRAEDALTAVLRPGDNAVGDVSIIVGHALRMQGELPRLAAQVERVLRVADDRADRFLETSAAFGGHVNWLAADAPEVSRHVVGALPWPEMEGAFHVQHWLRAEAEVETALYEGDARGAMARLAPVLPRLAFSVLRQLQSVRISCDFTLGRLVIGAREEGADAWRERAWLALARARLGRDPLSPAQVRARLLGAGCAALDGDRGAAVRELEAARALARASSHRLYEALAGYVLIRLGVLAGAGVHAVEETLEALGVVRPERFVRVELPGFGRLLGER